MPRGYVAAKIRANTARRNGELKKAMTTHELIEHFFAHSGRIGGSYHLEIQPASASYEVPNGRFRVWVIDDEKGSRDWVVVSKEELALLINAGVPSYSKTSDDDLIYIWFGDMKGDRRAAEAELRRRGATDEDFMHWGNEMAGRRSWDRLV